MSYIMYKGKQYCSNPTENTEQYITDAYNSTKTYAVGDYCIYNNTLLKCNTEITEPEEFVNFKWSITNVGDEIKSLGMAQKLNTAEVVVDSVYIDKGTIDIYKFGNIALVKGSFEFKQAALNKTIFTNLPIKSVLNTDMPLVTWGDNLGEASNRTGLVKFLNKTVQVTCNNALIGIGYVFNGWVIIEE